MLPIDLQSTSQIKPLLMKWRNVQIVTLWQGHIRLRWSWKKLMSRGSVRDCLQVVVQTTGQACGTRPDTQEDRRLELLTVSFSIIHSLYQFLFLFFFFLCFSFSIFDLNNTLTFKAEFLQKDHIMCFISSHTWVQSGSLSCDYGFFLCSFRLCNFMHTI